MKKWERGAYFCRIENAMRINAIVQMILAYEVIEKEGDKLVHLDQPESRDLQVPQDQPELLESQVLLVLRVLPGQLDQQEYRVARELRVRPEPREQLDQQALLESRALPVLQV